MDTETAKLIDKETTDSKNTPHWRECCFSPSAIADLSRGYVRRGELLKRCLKSDGLSGLLTDKDEELRNRIKEELK